MNSSTKQFSVIAAQIWLRCKTHKTSLILLLLLCIFAVCLSDSITANNAAIDRFQQKKQDFNVTKNNLTLFQQSAKNNHNNILFSTFKRKKFDQGIPENMLQKTFKKLGKKINVQLSKIRVTPDELWDKELNLVSRKITFSAHAKNSAKFYQFVHALQQNLPGLVIFKDVTFQNKPHNARRAYGEITFLWVRKKTSIN